jgi:hypothetical protein
LKDRLPRRFTTSALAQRVMWDGQTRHLVNRAARNLTPLTSPDCCANTSNSFRSKLPLDRVDMSIFHLVVVSLVVCELRWRVPWLLCSSLCWDCTPRPLWDLHSDE